MLDVGEIRISREEAARLPSETAPLYGGEEGYAGVLEVFHQLHCLVRITRVALRDRSLTALLRAQLEPHPQEVLQPDRPRRQHRLRTPQHIP